jgi:hypothetical protein
VATFAAVLIIVAGILTPIGLGETIVAGSFVNAKFEYATDPTSFGSETPPRNLYTLSRTCADGLVPCPGVDPSDSVIIQDEYSSSNTTLFDAYVLPNITDCFASGFRSMGDLRTSPFEIQFRQYQTYSTEEESTDLRGDRDRAKNRVANTTGDFAMVEKLVLLDKIVVREGIIADLVNGGVGFRNHTVPTTPRMRHGAQWTEDTLWLEPVTACVDTNWSVGHTQRSQPVSAYSPLWLTNLWLVNRGGGIVPTQIPDRKLLNLPSQSDPDLHSRAHLAGSMFNYRLSELLSLSSSNATVGSEYDSLDWDIFDIMFFQDFNGHKGLTLGPFQDPFQPLRFQTLFPSTVDLDPAQLKIEQKNRGFSPPDVSVEDACEYNPTTLDGESTQSCRNMLIYLHEVSACQGITPNSTPDIDLVLIRCGFLLTPPTRIINARDHILQSLYVCASTVRATVKEVSFQYKQIAEWPSLSDLSVSRVCPKKYSSSTSKPLWVVEKLGNEWNVSSIQPLWGIIDNIDSKSSQSLWAVENESLYLPDFEMNNGLYREWGDSMVSYFLMRRVLRLLTYQLQAASRGPGLFLDYVYRAHGREADYQGTQNGRMLAKWRELSASPETAAKIPNLIWTDLAANMLVGTKSLLSAFPDTQSYRVRSNKRQIFFHYAWAIPALMCAAIWILCAILCLTLYLIPQSRSRMRLSRLKVLINQLSVGRALVVADQFNAVGVEGSTKEWLATTGRRRINLSTLKDTAEDGMEMGPLPAKGERIGAGRVLLNQKEPSASTRPRRASF